MERAKFAKLINFQVWQSSLYALDENGTLWKNDHPPTANGWIPIPGPTIQQRGKEDVAIEHRFQIDKELI
jgi:hypothetical protein